MQVNGNKPILLSMERIDEFLNYLSSKDRSEETISKYAASLKAFYEFLPEGKKLDKESLDQWRKSLVDAGFAIRTVNTRIAACNSFLSFLDRKPWRLTPIAISDAESVSELTREEYLSLLTAARKSNNEWLYYLIKTFCCLGLSVSELHCLTVRAVLDGSVFLHVKKQSRTVRIPEVLQLEYLNFARRAKINNGSLFKSPEGTPLNKAYIIRELQALCDLAGVPAEKGTPKSLQGLYNNTYSAIRARSSFLIEEAYCKILEEEDKIAGWDNVAV